MRFFRKAEATLLQKTPRRNRFGVKSNLRIVSAPHFVRIDPIRSSLFSGAATVVTPHSPRQNHLIDTLPAAEYARLLPDLELIAMPLGWAVYESGGRMGYAYFPTTSIVSLLYVMENGASGETAIIGNEGLVGISLFMGGDTTPSRAVVQSAGHGATGLRRVLSRGSLRSVVGCSI
jgi:hypothetical protein